LGNLLIVVGLGGLALLLFAASINGRLLQEVNHAAVAAPAYGPTVTPTPPPEPADVASATLLGQSLLVDLSTSVPAPTPMPPPPPTSTPIPTPTEIPYVDITRLVLPRIDLTTDVVSAPLVHNEDNSLTWQIPPFVAGHAEGTAGAGEIGNAVLFGHVTSRQWGNVFLTLDKVKLNDQVQVFSGPTEFDYRVVDIRAVPRDDVSVLDPTPSASITLITCTGTWNPVLWDYMERLVVRAELATDGTH
jgi:LPXTG-site transpeptidase (sortase) family protein